MTTSDVVRLLLAIVLAFSHLVFTKETNLCEDIATKKIVAAAPTGDAYFTIVLDDFTAYRLSVENFKAHDDKTPPTFSLKLYDAQELSLEYLKRDRRIERYIGNARGFFFNNRKDEPEAPWKNGHTYLALFTNNRTGDKMHTLQLDNQEMNEWSLGDFTQYERSNAVAYFTAASHSKEVYNSENFPQFAAVRKNDYCTTIQAHWIYITRGSSMSFRFFGSTFWTAGIFYEEVTVGFVFFKEKERDDLYHGYALGFNQKQKTVIYYVIGKDGQKPHEDSLTIPYSKFFICSKDEEEVAKKAEADLEKGDSPEKNRQNNSNENMLLIVGVIVLLLLVGATYYFTQYKKGKKKKQKKSSVKKNSKLSKSRLNSFKSHMGTKSTMSIKSNIDSKGGSRSRSHDLRLTDSTCDSREDSHSRRNDSKEESPRQFPIDSIEITKSRNSSQLPAGASRGSRSATSKRNDSTELDIRNDSKESPKRVSSDKIERTKSKSSSNKRRSVDISRDSREDSSRRNNSKESPKKFLGDRIERTKSKTSEPLKLNLANNIRLLFASSRSSRNASKRSDSKQSPGQFSADRIKRTKSRSSARMSVSRDIETSKRNDSAKTSKLFSSDKIERTKSKSSKRVRPSSPGGSRDSSKRNDSKESPKRFSSDRIERTKSRSSVRMSSGSPRVDSDVKTSKRNDSAKTPKLFLSDKIERTKSKKSSKRMPPSSPGGNRDVDVSRRNDTNKSPRRFYHDKGSEGTKSKSSNRSLFDASRNNSRKSSKSLSRDTV